MRLHLRSGQAPSSTQRAPGEPMLVGLLATLAAAVTITEVMASAHVISVKPAPRIYSRAKAVTTERCAARLPATPGPRSRTPRPPPWSAGPQGHLSMPVSSRRFPPHGLASLGGRPPGSPARASSRTSRGAPSRSGPCDRDCDLSEVERCRRSGRRASRDVGARLLTITGARTSRKVPSCVGSGSARTGSRQSGLDRPQRHELVGRTAPAARARLRPGLDHAIPLGQAPCGNPAGCRRASVASWNTIANGWSRDDRALRGRRF